MGNFQKDLHVSVLLDYYGELLSEKQRNFLELYYNEDFSLGEIAEHENITRQGVHDLIRHGEKKLYEYENTLHLAEKSKCYTALCAKISELAHEIRLSGGKSAANEKAFEIENLINKYKDLL